MTPLREIHWTRTALSAMEQAAITSALGQPPGRDARALKSDGRAWVRKQSIGGRAVTIKCRPLHGVLDRLRVRLGSSRFARHWTSAQWLTAHHILTPQSMLLGTANDGQGAVELLVLDFLPGRTVLEVLAARDIDPALLRPVATALARQIAAMTDAGRFNRDHKPSNLLITERATTNGAPEIAVLDCVGLRPTLARQVWRGADRMLASLMIEPTGCGVPVPMRLRARLVREVLAGWWQSDSSATSQRVDEQFGVERVAWMQTSMGALWTQIARLIEAHGDPTPRVDPLNRAAR